MDCKSNVVFRVLLLIIVFPAVLWGYSKTVLGFVQTSSDMSVDGSLPANDKTSGAGNAAAGKNNRPGGPQRTDRRRAVQPLELQVSSPVQTGFSNNPELVDVSSAGGDGGSVVEDPAGKETAAETGSISLERRDIPAPLEPIQAEGTYNQVRVKRPLIPSRFDIPGRLSDRDEEPTTGLPVSFVGLLGVPTLVFSVLFFVMWGIISGQIQRIMF